MSSYISGSYHVAPNPYIQIRGQCQQELEHAKRQAQANRDEFIALIQKRREAAQHQVKEEQQLQNSVAEAIIHNKHNKIYERKQIEQLIDQADSQVAKCEKALGGQHTELRTHLETMRNSFKLFGATTHLLEELTRFCNQEIPNEQIIIEDQAREKSLKKQIESVPKMKTHLRDYSGKFVSLYNSDNEKRKSGESPWNLFMQKLRFVAELKNEMGEPAAQEMLAQAEQIAPGMQNLFLLQNSQTLNSWEEELALDLNLQESAQQEIQLIYNEYLAACSLCDEVPTILPDAPIQHIKHECNRLKEKHIKLREQQFVTEVLTDVLENHGIDFESMEFGEDGKILLEYSLDERAGVRILRSSSGAFEMQFSARSKTQTISQDQLSETVEQAHSFCKMLPGITKELAERGILFDDTMVQEPSEETVQIEYKNEVSHRQEKSKYLSMR